MGITSDREIRKGNHFRRKRRNGIPSWESRGFADERVRKIVSQPSAAGTPRTPEKQIINNVEYTII